MRFPSDLKYTKDHEWARVEDNKIFVGITDHAQAALGDIVFVELPTVGRSLKKGETFGVVESIKAVSDLYSPATGKVIAINQKVVSEPGLLNREPHGAAWLIQLELADSASTQDLMDVDAYSKYVETLK